ncbi:cache domain-containing sensor histidine kinase [Lacrimispora sinapis]|uniref:cache domain-containing sensor histidine kinase n=1 Tax=Lacrimispora sinapis TaxID=3111456 RepID=UPI003749107E
MGKKKRFIGIFTKLAVIFAVIGLLPYLLISRFFFSTLVNNVEEVMLSNGQTTLDYLVSYVDGAVGEWESQITKLYIQPVNEDRYLWEVLKNPDVSGDYRDIYIRRALSKIDMETYITSIRFLDNSGNVYYISGEVGKIADPQGMKRWREEELERVKTEPVSHNAVISPVHMDRYFTNINTGVITIRRDFFDISSLRSVEERLGTLYLDINEKMFEDMIGSVTLGKQSGFYIVNQKGETIYSNQERERDDLMPLLLERASTERQGVMETDDSYYLYRKNQVGDWISVVKIHRNDVLANVAKNERYILIVLTVSSVFLMAIYILFSSRISIPIRRLKDGMVKIQQGNLDTRVEVTSQDEIGILAEGFNQMASQLKDYIEKVYGAEISQREAELKAIKSQIKPHYLYNTLDVIRMTAVTNDDFQTADMIESLARQLRYLIGESGDKVSLMEELANVKDYFMLMKIRYEDRIRMTVSVPASLYDASVLKLCLQPIVENAVSHGLKMKKEEGTINVSAKVLEGTLEITVMDNGVGIESAELERIQSQLSQPDGIGRKTEDLGVGLLSVHQRIRKNYGMQYGIQILSTSGTGTIVIVTMPYERRGDSDDKSTADR